MKQSKGKIYNFLRANKYITVAIVGEDGKPQAATVKYILNDDSIIIDISKGPNKNLLPFLRDNNIACVITADRVTLQIEAHSQILEGRAAENAKEKMAAALPERAEHFTDSTKFFSIEPLWLNLQDYNKRPIEEVYYDARN